MRNCKYLDSTDCIFWAKAPYWDHQEAIHLSMGIHPEISGNVATTDEEAERMGADYRRRSDIADRAGYIKQLECLLIPSEDGRSKIVYLPNVFSEWAKKILPSFPQELYEAVLQHPQNDPQKSKEAQVQPKGAAADNTVSDSNIDADMWKKAIRLVVADQIEKIDAVDKSHRKNALQKGTPTWPYEIKAVYRSLLHVNSNCKCISLALEKIVLSEMKSETADFTDEQIKACEGTKLEFTRYLTSNHLFPANTESAIKRSVKLAMAAEPTDEPTIASRAYKGSTWDTKWHGVKCLEHPESSNAAPKKKTKSNP